MRFIVIVFYCHDFSLWFSIFQGCEPVESVIKIFCSIFWFIREDSISWPEESWWWWWERVLDGIVGLRVIWGNSLKQVDFSSLGIDGELIPYFVISREINFSFLHVCIYYWCYHQTLSNQKLSLNGLLIIDFFILRKLEIEWSEERPFALFTHHSCVHMLQ